MLTWLPAGSSASTCWATSTSRERSSSVMSSMVRFSCSWIMAAVLSSLTRPVVYLS